MIYDLYGQQDHCKPDTGTIGHTDESEIIDTIRMFNKAGVDKIQSISLTIYASVYAMELLHYSFDDLHKLLSKKKKEVYPAR